jgi:hypothetical protein
MTQTSHRKEQIAMADRPIPWTTEHHRSIVHSTLKARSTSQSIGVPGRDRSRELREAEAKRK